MFHEFTKVRKTFPLTPCAEKGKSLLARMLTAGIFLGVCNSKRYWLLVLDFPSLFAREGCYTTQLSDVAEPGGF
jgi:hypothetical protein